MAQRIVWVHGIGHHTAGYSDAWREAFDVHLLLGSAGYHEVVWDDVFHPPTSPTRSGTAAATAVSLTPQEELEAQALREELTAILQARGADGGGGSVTRAGGGTVEWTAAQQADAATRGALTWLFNPDEYLGDFVKYLVSRSVRSAVKERLKAPLRDFVGQDLALAIVGHSWGTVVAYDSLLDLSAELPQLRAAHLFTLGSPLWLVRRLLEDRSGRKPANLSSWVNVHARGDLVGSWLQPAFKVDKDFQVPSMGDDAHGSYFVAHFMREL